jgi:hypothetical protein
MAPNRTPDSPLLLSLSLPNYEVSGFGPPHALLPFHKPKATGPTDHGLKCLKPRQILFISWLSKTFCYSNGKLTNIRMHTNMQKSEDTEKDKSNCVRLRKFLERERLFSNIPFPFEPCD